MNLVTLFPATILVDTRFTFCSYCFWTSGEMARW